MADAVEAEAAAETVDVTDETDRTDGAEDATDETDPTDGAEDATDATEDADALKKGEVKGLTEEAQEAVNRRIGKVVAREKTAIERADQAEAELEAARVKLDGGLPELVKRLGLHGDLVTKSEAETLDRYGKLKAQRSWCRQHEDGYEGRGEGDPSIDAKTVRQRLVQIEDELDEMGATAKEIQGRVEKQAREIWKAGKEALKRKAEGGDLKPEKDGGKKLLAKPPKIPGGTGTPKAPASAKKSKGTFDKDEFEKGGGGKAALEKQFEKLYG